MPQPIFADGTRLCRKCDQIKLLDQFRKRGGKERGVTYACKECLNARDKARRNPRTTRNAFMRCRYGLSEEEYMQMLERQAYRCICFQRLIPYDKDTCVDHCHYTGKVRGLLCRRCNFAIGWADENPLTLELLARYIYKHEIGDPALEKLKYETPDFIGDVLSRPKKSRAELPQP